MENESAIEEIENARVRHADHLSLFFMLLQLSPKQKFFFFLVVYSNPYSLEMLICFRCKTQRIYILSTSFHLYENDVFLSNI